MLKEGSLYTLEGMILTGDYFLGVDTFEEEIVEHESHGFIGRPAVDVPGFNPIQVSTGHGSGFSRMIGDLDIIKYEEILFVGNQYDFPDRNAFVKLYLQPTIIPGNFMTNMLSIVIGDYTVFNEEKKILHCQDWVYVGDLLDLSDANYDIVLRAKSVLENLPKNKRDDMILQIIDFQIAKYDKF